MAATATTTDDDDNDDDNVVVVIVIEIDFSLSFLPEHVNCGDWLNTLFQCVHIIMKR